MIRLYAPVLVLIVFVGLAAAGVSCPIGFGATMALALVLHVRALMDNHVERFHRRRPR